MCFYTLSFFLFFFFHTTFETCGCFDFDFGFYNPRLEQPFLNGHFDFNKWNNNVILSSLDSDLQISGTLYGTKNLINNQAHKSRQHQILEALESEHEKNFELKLNKDLVKIAILFVDEAQDLNEIQFNIIDQLYKKLGVIINLIGDPNQNIYQFRDSESKYFIEFQAIEFKLTTNFRSHAEIINFSNKLRHDQTHQIISNKGYNNIKPIFSVK